MKYKKTIKYHFFIRLAIFFFIFIVMAQTKAVMAPNLPAIPTNANVICLYNSNDAVSREICDYYVDKRSGASKLGLNVPDSIFDNTLISQSAPVPRYKEWSSLADFLNYVKRPLDDYVAAHPELKITHVAVAKGLPIKIVMPIIPPIETTDASGNPVRITKSHMSNTTALEPELDYSLCAVIDEACSKTLYNRDNQAKLLPGAVADFNPYWRARSVHLLEHFAAAAYQSFRLGMRPKFVSANLNGYNLEDIKKMIDRAQDTAPDLSNAKWVVDGDAKNIKNNDFWEEEFATAHKYLTTAGIPAANLIFEKTDIAPLDLLGLGGPLVGYYGYGTHHPNYFFDWALSLVKAPVANRAVVTAYESFNGDTFSIDPYTPWSKYLRATDVSYFSKPADFISSIAFGGTDYSRSFSGGYGNVYEPGPPGADHAEDFFLSYASGMTLAEAFFNTWESPNNIAWGDPLMRITDSTDNRKPNGMACLSDAECQTGRCLADDLGFKFCFSPDDGSCLFAKPRDPRPEIRLYNIAAPNGKTICEYNQDGKSQATLTCSNSEWRRAACAIGGQCVYTPTPNVYYDYLASSFTGAVCKQECSMDADCSNGYCDVDLDGAKRCHRTANACMRGKTGLEQPNTLEFEVPNGVDDCTTDQRYKAQCHDGVWSKQPCQNGCIFGSCVEEFYDTAAQTFNLSPQRRYLLTWPINIGSKMISEVFTNPAAGTKIRVWDKQARAFGAEKTYAGEWSGGDIIIRSGDVFQISVPANYSFRINGTEFDSVLPFSIKSGTNQIYSPFGLPYCAAEYTASKLLGEISAVDNRCALIRTGYNRVDPTLYWSEAGNAGLTAIKQDFKILPFAGYLIQCAEGVDFTFTPACPAPVNASCSTTLNNCTAGTLSDISDSTTYYFWNCVGSNGGTDISCRLPLAPVNGSCETAFNTCSLGTLLDIADSATRYFWNCLGLNGGIAASCSLPIPPVCVSFTYSAWGACVNGQQARTIFTSSPAGCAAGAPITTKSCTLAADTTPPVVSLITPANNSAVFGIVALSASAFDPEVTGQAKSGVSIVQFKLNNQNIGQELTASPYSFAWNPAGFANGAHTLAAIAQDIAGNRATSSIAITISNAADNARTARVPQSLAVAIDTPADAQFKQILVDAVAVWSDNVSAILANAQAARNPAAEKITAQKYLANLTNGQKNLSSAQTNRLNYFITYGTVSAKILGAGERAGVINSYKSAFGKLPKTETEWQDAIKIANGRWPSERNVTAEIKAKTLFKKIYGREPKMNQQNDNAAVTIMTYGLRPAKRNLNSERAAIKSFKFYFKKNPVTAVDWDAVRAIAYSGAKR